MLGGDGGLAQALRLASHTVIGVCVTILPTQRLVGAVTLDGITRAAGTQLFHQTHTIEGTVLASVCKKNKTMQLLWIVQEITLL